MILPLLLAAAVAAAAPTSVDVGAGKLYATPESGAQLTGLTVVVSAGTARETNAQNGLAALTAESILFGRIDGTPLTRRVAADGGSVDVAVGPSVVRFTIEALPGTLAAVSSDVARAIATPDTSPGTIAAARDELTSEIADAERSPTTVGLQMLRNSYYEGAAGRPPYGTSESLAELTPADVTAFESAHYVRGNVFATATGVVDAGTNDAANTVLAAFPAGSEAPPAVAAHALGAQAKRIVTHRDIGVPFVLLGFAAPSLSDSDFAAMLVLRAILSDITDRGDVTTAAPIERGLDIVYAYDVKPATFIVAINGALLDPTAGLTIVQAIARNALTKPFTSDVIRRYKDTARGQWALEALTLSDRAWQIGAAVSEGADPSVAANVVDAIDRVTPADVQRIAKRYLQRYLVALVLPRGLR